MAAEFVQEQNASVKVDLYVNDDGEITHWTAENEPPDEKSVTISGVKLGASYEDCETWLPLLVIMALGYTTPPDGAQFIKNIDSKTNTFDVGGDD